MRHWLIRLALPALLAAPASAQLQGKTCLAFQLFQAGGTSKSAAANLGMTVKHVWEEPAFYAAFASQTWDLLIIDMPQDSIITDKEKFADAVAVHVAAGGRVLCNFTNLDEHPTLQQVLGVAGTVEKLEPSPVFRQPPGNPIWPNTGIIVNTTGFDEWPDNGDELTPTTGSHVAALFDSGMGPPAAVISNELRSITNGFDWESLGTTSPQAKREIQFLFACHGDYDENGVLDVFDYLAFVNDFNMGRGDANVNFDTSLDLFDFLAFINLFNEGCS